MYQFFLNTVYIRITKEEALLHLYRLSNANARETR